MQMFRICAVLAIELLEPRKAAESIAKPRSTTEFWEGTSPKCPLVTMWRATNPGRAVS
jgi:hypothetical protein